MTPEQIFKVVSIGGFLVPCSITLSVLALPWPRNTVTRSVLAVLLAWVVSVFYTAYVYNPAGIEYGHQIAMDFPESRYDNNTTASALLGGWFLPAAIAGVFFVVSYVLHRVRKQRGDT